MFQTEYEFTLPRGYLETDGTLHRDGIMRLATAADEILPLQDPRVGKNPAYLLIILLSRVVIKLGNVRQITPKTIEDLFTGDLTYLQEFYNRINGYAADHMQVECPGCRKIFEVEPQSQGGSAATPWNGSAGR
jgi:hypothetical protein